MVVREPCLYQIVIFSCFSVYGVVAHAVNMKMTSSTMPIKAVPFVASLQGSGLRRPCAASVIHDLFLLTAASCLVDDFGLPINYTKALVGTNNLYKGGYLYDIESTLPHKKYSIHTGDYNIGLVKLAEKIAFRPNVRPIKLGKTVKVGDVVHVVGWGMVTKSSGILHEVSVSVLRKEECQQGLLGRIILPRMLCAGAAGEKRGDCVSDVGGPVFANESLVAVASHSDGCGRLPGLYTRVAAVGRWITSTIHNNLV